MAAGVNVAAGRHPAPANTAALAPQPLRRPSPSPPAPRCAAPAQPLPPPAPPPAHWVDSMRSRLGRGGDAKQEAALQETIKKLQHKETKLQGGVQQRPRALRGCVWEPTNTKWHARDSLASRLLQRLHSRQLLCSAGSSLAPPPSLLQWSARRTCSRSSCCIATWGPSSWMPRTSRPMVCVGRGQQWQLWPRQQRKERCASGSEGETRTTAALTLGAAFPLPLVLQLPRRCGWRATRC